MKKETTKTCIIFTFIIEIACVVMFLVGKLTFYQFVTSITLLDILQRLESRDLREMGDRDEVKKL